MYSNSELNSHKRISPHRSSRGGQPVSKITIHHTAGNIGLEALGSWLSRPETRASYNYGISSDGRIGLFVEERDASWASSNRANDAAAVTIGVANSGGAPDWPVSDAAYASLLALIRCVCVRNGIGRLIYDGTSHSSNLTRHDMFSRQVCPGPFLRSRFPVIAAEVNRQLETNTPALDVTILANGKPIGVKGYIQGGRTWAPIAPVLDAAGVRWRWSSSQKSINLIVP